MSIPFVFGSHDTMKDLERRAGSIGRSGLPVLIEGPCGAGKETLAELLHELSESGGNFTRILCRQSGPTLHSSAARANGGMSLGDFCRGTRSTVFLKNVHLLSPAGQEELLVALEQAAEWNAKKGTVPATRILSSATESLDELVSRNQWSPSLYHRLSVYRICLPRLGERRHDIPELFIHMIRRASNGSGAAPPAPSRLIDALMAYAWPGNLRELENIARTYVVTAHADEIIAELSQRSHLIQPSDETHVANWSLKEQVKGASQKLEYEIILRTLGRHQWNRRRTAQSLQISYRSLLYKMKSCNLRIQPPKAGSKERESHI
jgi:two-component system response regulator AtoC